MRIRRIIVSVLPLLLVAAPWMLPAASPATPTDPLTAQLARTTLVGSRYTDVAGNAVTLGQAQPSGTAGMVLIFINTECPISNKLVPEMNRLAAEARQKHLEFYGVLSDPTVTRVAAQKHSREFQVAFPVLFDASGTLAAALQPAVTPHAFLVDPHGKVVYSGRINDSYASVGNPKNAGSSNDLEEAIAAVAAGKAPPVGATQPVGCIFESWKRPAKDAKVTWSRDIAPILYANCTACHHEGEVAPFSLMSYGDAAKRAEMLAAVTQSRQMPPWKAADPWGTFHDERRLTDAQIALLQQWAQSGAPEGDKADAPPAPGYSEKWKLGTPDLVVKMPKPFNVPASGRDLMAYTVIPLNLDGDRNVIAFDYRPGNRKVVHHMIALLDSTGAAREIARARGDGTSYVNFGGPGFLPTGGIGGWAPGASPRFLPEGVGRPLRKGSDLIIQCHYHPSGKPESDQGELALYFAKGPIQHVAFSIPLSNRQIDIPPGDNNYIRTVSVTTPLDVTLEGVTPHMHNLGREMRITATFPDGRVQQLIDVNDWDWNWQDQYVYQTPVKLPRGTKVDLWARYDNSRDNPRNPQDPPKRVTFGEQTSNEMCIGFLQLTVDGLRVPARGQAPGAVVRQWVQELRQQQQR